tara:strand:- start:2868 stop:3188 length:321 start_codon:yes stop_codon:yes gene_type:complete
MNSEENKLDMIDNIYYNNLYKINKLFNKDIYNCKIGAKTDSDSVNQIIIYLNKKNISEKYSLYINNKYSIGLSIPIKNSNILFKTFFYSIEDVYKFLEKHINVNIT